MNEMINTMLMQIPAKSENESFARSVVAAFCVGLNPTIDEINDIKTAVSEAVTNAIVHAYPVSLGKVTVKAAVCEGNLLEITVKDRGRGIQDIDKARQPMYTTGGEERSGMGFTIMESFMDRVSVRSVLGKGTTVVMRKKLAARLPAAK